MDLPSPDPRIALVAGVGTGIVSPRFRRAVGRGIGYLTRGLMKVGAPLTAAGRDVYESAREVAAPHRGDA